VVVATDDARILDHCRELNMNAVVTASAHQSGTDRVGEVAQERPAHAYVNIQCDEPLIPPAALDALVNQALATDAEMATLVSPVESDDRDILSDPNVVKAAVGEDGYALYFSRFPIPYPRSPQHARHYRHVGVYYYSRDALLRFVELSPTRLELTEGLEQLRALEAGMRILAVSHAYAPVGVDVPDDVKRVEKILRREGELS
jgi:3-deoxy-manno-octulosonate cytidylyltransferase (CMP-KDO synthetase)